MPQSERSEILKKLLRWLNAKDKGATLSEIVYNVKWEITEGGATDKAIKKYLEDLKGGGKIEYRHPFWKISSDGKTWLERHGI